MYKRQAYKDAVAGKWFMQEDIPESEGNLVVMDAEADAEKIASMVDFVFCAVNMKKDEIKALEEKYAKLECPVVSNNSAHRWTCLLYTSRRIPRAIRLSGRTLCRRRRCGGRFDAFR